MCEYINKSPLMLHREKNLLRDRIFKSIIGIENNS